MISCATEKLTRLVWLTINICGRIKPACSHHNIEKKKKHSPHIKNADELIYIYINIFTLIQCFFI